MYNYCFCYNLFIFLSFYHLINTIHYPGPNSFNIICVHLLYIKCTRFVQSFLRELWTGEINGKNVNTIIVNKVKSNFLSFCTSLFFSTYHFILFLYPAPISRTN
ncbi:hypothetical protein NQ317_004122 [Molorchus minor]|uniref:Secreted protein n=1 Tax=Molorchus minor TaxID=1323400 RepID=A0ABQ9J2K9_9CUCU|nr:hypothetical protein NQ317_004122 [Molorchus minor]